MAEDSFAILFASGPAGSNPEAELKSIGYVLAQEILDPNLTVAPDIYIGSAWLKNSFDTFSGLISVAEASLAPLKRFGAAKPPTKATSAATPTWAASSPR